MNLQTSNDGGNIGMSKLPSSKMPVFSSSSKRVQPVARISKEAMESWIKDHPNSDLVQAVHSFGISYVTLLRYCKKYGISRSRSKYQREALKDYLLSHPYARYIDIAKHFGSVKSSAKKAVDRYGLHSLRHYRRSKE